MRLNRVNEYLKKNEIIPVEENYVLNGPDAVKNILVSEITDIGRLDKISDELITYLSKDLKRQSRKDQQSFLRDVETIKANKRDFVYRFMQDINKNEFLNKVFEASTKEKEIVVSENGTVYESSITDENRKQLSELLRDILDTQTRG